MDKSTFKKQFKKREMIWNVSATSILFLVVALSVFVTCRYDFNILSIILINIAVLGFSLNFISFIESHYMSTTYLKRYWIEDLGSIIKLHGGVQVIHYGKAKKELLSIRPGLKIVDDFNRYNCTLVAIPATVEEKQAKKEIEGLGFVQNIYS